MPARPCNCCCSCTCSQDRWDDLGEAFSYSHNVDTATVTLTQITDDGTTLACKDYEAPAFSLVNAFPDTRVIAKKSPSLQIALDVEWEQGISAPSGHTPGTPWQVTHNYIFGRIYPECQFTPTGDIRLDLFLRIDTALRYMRAETERRLTADGSVIVNNDITFVDADQTPPVGGYTVFQTKRPSCAVKQGDRIFFLNELDVVSSGFPGHVITKRIEGVTGKDMNPTGAPEASFPANKSGDWMRHVTNSAFGAFIGRYFFIDWENSPDLWLTWNDPATAFDDAFRTDLAPDLCDTENPISFGWFWTASAGSTYSNAPVSLGGTIVDDIAIRNRYTGRIDAWCVNRQEVAEDQECPSESTCCEDDLPETITVSVDEEGSGGCYTGTGTFTLPRVPADGVESRWAGDDDESTPWVIECVDGEWSIDAIDINLTAMAVLSASCEPFEVVFEKTSGACLGTIVTVTV